MDRAFLNQINRASRICPEKALKKLRTLEVGVALSDLNPSVKALRTNWLKRDRELRDACIFCYGMSQKINQPVWVYPTEAADFDFVAGWEVDGRRHFAPTQLKEVVPTALNPQTSLQSVINGLTKYKTSEQLTVAIHLNQKGRFKPSEITLPDLKLASLWIFAAASEDQSQWFIFGNMLEEGSSWIHFTYPQ